MGTTGSGATGAGAGATATGATRAGFGAAATGWIARAGGSATGSGSTTTGGGGGGGAGAGTGATTATGNGGGSPPSIVDRSSVAETTSATSKPTAPSPSTPTAAHRQRRPAGAGGATSRVAAPPDGVDPGGARSVPDDAVPPPQVGSASLRAATGIGPSSVWERPPELPGREKRSTIDASHLPPPNVDSSRAISCVHSSRSPDQMARRVATSRIRRSRSGSSAPRIASSIRSGRSGRSSVGGTYRPFATLLKISSRSSPGKARFRVTSS